MENVNGRKLVEGGDLCERRNGIAICLASRITKFYFFSSTKIVKFKFYLAGRGVDLNRNWSVDWGKKEKVCSLDLHW